MRACEVLEFVQRSAGVLDFGGQLDHSRVVDKAAITFRNTSSRFGSRSFFGPHTFGHDGAQPLAPQVSQRLRVVQISRR